MYRVVVLQEEPYLFANGSGYVPDLMKRIAETYSSLHNGVDLPYDIVPVKTWSQLLTKAKSSRGQISFGLVVPSLDLTSWNWKSFQTSAPTMYSSVKVVSKRGSLNPEDEITSGHLQLKDGLRAMVMKGSPLEFVLLQANNYRGPVQSVDNVDDAFDYLRSNEDAAFLASSGVADQLVVKSVDELVSTCTKKIPGTSGLFYAFFGRDSKLLEQLNQVILHLMSNDGLLSLYAKYFAATRQCQW